MRSPLALSVVASLVGASTAGAHPIPYYLADVQIRPGGAPGWVGASLGVADADCDGVADVLTANPLAGPYAEGEVYIVPGPASGWVRPLQTTVLTNSVRGENGYLGNALAGGDLDGDGCDDVVVDAPAARHRRGNPHAPISSTYVFFGPVTADQGTQFAADLRLDSTVSTTQELASLAITPDMDGDGANDLVVTRPSDGDVFWSGVVYVAPGDATTGSRLETDATYVIEGDDIVGWLGHEISALGDVTGDGIAELAVSDYGEQEVYVLEGGAAPGAYSPEALAVTTLGSSTEFDTFGTGLVSADYDGDGSTNLFVAAPSGYASTGARSGVVYGFLGPFAEEVDESAAFVSWESTDDDDALGEQGAVAVGDVDGDGQLDVAIGSETTPQREGTGVVYLQVGAASGVVDVGTLLYLPASGPADRYGHAVAFVPDWTGDGGDELAIGAPYSAGGANREIVGAVVVFDSVHFY